MSQVNRRAVFICGIRYTRNRYSLSSVTDDERMQRESSLIATIRKSLPDFAKACADDKELGLLHQDAFAADAFSLDTNP